MLFTMIKNNLKLMLRNKLMILLVVIAPIMIMAALSSAFDGLLQGDYEYEHMKVGYATEEGSLLDSFFKENVTQFKEQKIELKQLEESVGINEVKIDELDVFLVEKEKEITVYSKEENSIPTEMCEYMLSLFYKEYGNSYREAVYAQMGSEMEANVNFQTGALEGLQLSSAGNYYGIIEVVYFIWMMGMLFLTAVVYSERRNRISQRFISAPASSFLIYLSKFVPSFIFTCVGTLISSVVATILFDVQWTNLLGSIGILFCTILAGTALGIAVLYMVNNLAVSVIINFAIVWVTGFFGGSFETYMFTSTPEKVKCLSPLYYVNRTLVEFSLSGKSDYTGRCVVITLIIFVVCSLLGSILMKKRMEEE